MPDTMFPGRLGRSDMVVSLVLEFLIVFSVITVYFFPAYIAFRRHHQRRVAILATNLLLGWTVVGGFAALFWSLTSKRVFL